MDEHVEYEHMSRIYIRPLQWQAGGSGAKRVLYPYDLFIGTVGYETRAPFVLNSLVARPALVVSAPLSEEVTPILERNRSAFAQVGEVLSHLDFRKHLASTLSSLETVRRVHSEPLRVCVDISSMNRPRIAETMLAFYADYPRAIDVDWMYAPAKFSTKLLGAGPVRVNDSVPGFEGWADPIRPLHALVGAGLEGSLVLGVLDDLEPSETWIFEPFGIAKSYDDRIQKLNKDVFAAIPNERHFMYSILEPYTGFLKLSSLVNDLTRHGRVVIIPLGPKPFALFAFLIGAEDRENVSVWRLSTSSDRDPIDRVPTGQIVGLKGISSRT